MANLFGKLRVKKSASNRSTFNLSQNHLTTFNFGEVLPIYHRNLIPSDNFKLNNIGAFARVAPMACPTYGTAKLNFVNIFVPYRLVCEHASAWINGQEFDNGSVALGRFFYVRDLIILLNNSLFSVEGTSSNFDYSFVNSQNDRVFRKFTNNGKHLYKIFQMLGYELFPDISTVSTIKFNAFNILCFLRAYNDWFVNDGTYNNSDLSVALDAVRNHINNSDVDGLWKSYNGGIIDIKWLITENTPLFIAEYEPDYITSAFVNPIGENIVGSANLKSINSYIPDGLGEDESSYIGIGDSGKGVSYDSLRGIQSTSIKALLAFDRWARIHNFTSSRIGEQLLARFGVKVEDYKSNVSTLLSRSDMVLNIGDVTSTASTEQEALGAYAGKGIINGDGNGAHINVDEYGLFLTLAYASVNPIYYQRVDRDNLRLEPNDYFMPEFENLGMQPISVMEVSADPKAVSSSSHSSTRVFGFQPRYTDYKVPFDQITGDFRNADMASFHFGRNMNFVYYNDLTVGQQVRSMGDRDQYLRIFQDTNKDFDHFYLNTYFDITCSRPMLSIQESFDLGNDMEVRKANNTPVGN